MGLFELNHNYLTGNSLNVGNMIITWDNPEETEGDTSSPSEEALSTNKPLPADSETK